MLRFVLFLFLVSFSLSALATQQDISEKTLANGLRVVVKPINEAPVVMVQLWYHVGSLDEPVNDGGVSHFLEHLMFRGTNRYKDGEFDQLMSQYGGTHNAFTSKNNTVYFEAIPTSALSKVLNLEADRMNGVKLTPTSFAKEKLVVMEERRMRTEDNPAMILREQFDRVAYPISRYGNPIIGWMSILQNLTLNQVANWYKAWYVPNNAVLVIVGDVKPDAVFKKAQRDFGSIPAKPLPLRLSYPLPPRLGLKMVDVHSNAKVPMVMIGYHVPVIKTAKVSWQPYALHVLSFILANGPTSLMQRQLVQQQQLLASVGSHYPLLARQNSLLRFVLYPSRGVSMDKAIAGVNQVIESVVNQPVSSAQLKRAKTVLIADYLYGQDSLMAQATLLGKLASNSLPLILSASYVNSIQAVTAKQVQQVAQQYLTPRNETLGVLIPEEVKS